MSTYQVIARKYRPQTFKDVLGQDATVTTLKNAIKHGRLAHAYLFSGARGTGKTTLARVFAKALNCKNPSSDFEPCQTCASCKEITSGNSLDVLEIDGASHRGIDDVRQINDTVGYAAASGKFKIYIIDEVHMLTKEAFNALLKTLEEPPPNVKFFFATTEPHKVLPTILSRCQRFNLNRIPSEKIIGKLKNIAEDLKLSVEEDALALIAARADGGLRDAESLLDQILAFHEGPVTKDSTAEMLGIMPKDRLFDLDAAGKAGNLAIAFEIVNEVFSEGKDLPYFLETLLDHFRTLLLVKLSGKDAPFLSTSEKEALKYENSAKCYNKEQLSFILDFLVQELDSFRFHPSPRIALEAILMRILRSHHRIPVDFLVRKLSELESKLQEVVPPPAEPLTERIETEKKNSNVIPSVSVDPTPTKADLEIKPSAKQKKVSEKASGPSKTEAPIEIVPLQEADPQIIIKKQSRYDTLLQFAAVELEGSVKKV